MEGSAKPKPTLKPKESSSGHKKKIDPVEKIETLSEGGILVIRLDGRKVDVEQKNVE